MEQALIVNLDSVVLRFTPDGKVAVVDAIQAVSNSDSSYSIWENLKAEHPEILIYCEDYSFQGESPVPVINSKGWERVWMLLPDYLSDPDVI
ncbi:MAG: hypothetical protein ACETWD_05840 [Desulfatiglandales bacterium]